MRNSQRKASLFTVLVPALLTIALVMRVLGAWCLRHNLNPDAGVAALMARHIAAGTDFPVFFYGQPYMGSFEPTISAALCWLFGCSGFVVCLGTALLGVATLPFIYLWARDLESRSAGLAALAWCIVGPCGFFHYHVSPRGGYAATLFFSTLVLWLSARLIARERSTGSSRSPASAWYFLLGLLAGLGWWTNQLITASLFTAALLFVLLILPRLFFRRTIAALCGFMLGSLPFWWWNAANHWGSFSFAGSFGQRPVWDGLGLFFLERCPDLVALGGVWRWQGILPGGIYIAAALVTAGVVLNAARRRRMSPAIAGLMLLVFFLVSALIFSTSHFAGMKCSRYLLPLVPVTAVMVGVMTARIQAWLPRNLAWAAWLPLLILIAFQLPALRWFVQRMRGEEKYQRQIESVGKFLHQRGVEASYIPYALYAWKFALRETNCLSQLPVDRYPPHSRQAELAETIAVLHNEGGVKEFLEAYGGTVQIERPAGIYLHTDFEPPGPALAMLPVNTAESIVDSRGRDALAPATDRNLDTWWESGRPDDSDEWVEIRFRQAERISMLRLLFFPEYPPELQVEGQDSGGAWHRLTPILPASGYFWSGPRPYYGDWLYRLNILLPGVAVRALRLRRIGVKFGIRELQWFAPTASGASEKTSFPALLQLVRERGINRLYCDRWVANAMHRACGQDVDVPLAPVIFDKSTPKLGVEMRLTPQTGILAREEDALICREVLAQRMVSARETVLAPWVLFDFEPGSGPGMPGEALGLQWSGFACFLTDNKSWAATLARRADALCRQGRRADALELLFRAAGVYTNYHPVTDRLAWWLEAERCSDAAAAWRKMSALLAEPEIRAEIRFRNGVTFRGITLSKCRVQPGETLTIRYYWTYPVEPFRDLPRVFVHFQLATRPAGGARGFFQDDHPLPRPAAANNQPLPEVFRTDRQVLIPPNLPPGKYIVQIGLFEPARQDRRIPAETLLPGERDAFTLPVTLEVTVP